MLVYVLLRDPFGMHQANPAANARKILLFGMEMKKNVRNVQPHRSTTKRQRLAMRKNSLEHAPMAKPTTIKPINVNRNWWMELLAYVHPISLTTTWITWSVKNAPLTSLIIMGNPRFVINSLNSQLSRNSLWLQTVRMAGIWILRPTPAWRMRKLIREAMHNAHLKLPSGIPTISDAKHANKTWSGTRLVNPAWKNSRNLSQKNVAITNNGAKSAKPASYVRAIKNTLRKPKLVWTIVDLEKLTMKTTNDVQEQSQNAQLASLSMLPSCGANAQKASATGTCPWTRSARHIAMRGRSTTTRQAHACEDNLIFIYPVHFTIA